MDPLRLLHPEALEVIDLACADDREDLRLSEDLRRRFDPDLVAIALTQRALRRRAAGKLTDPQSWLLTREGLEQATATAVAAHRAEAFTGLSAVVDVCCGIGGDSRELATKATTVVGVDRDPVHLELARHNTGLIPVQAEAGGLPLGRGVDAILVDPARREDGRRRRGHAESSPPLGVCFGWANEFRRVVVKAAPGLDLDVVPEGWSIEAVAVGRDLKELALWAPAWDRPVRQATVLRVDAAGRTLSTDVLTGDGTQRNKVGVTDIGRYLFDPSPAVTRSGLVQDLGELLGASMVDERIAFLTSDRSAESPLARTLQVRESLPWSLKPVKARLRALDIGQVEIRQRGLTGGDTESLRRRLATDGDGSGVLVLTRIGDRPWALICAEL